MHNIKMSKTIDKTEYYLNPKAIFRASSIEGNGLFANKKIIKGEIIHIAVGRVFHFDDQSPTEGEWDYCYR